MTEIKLLFLYVKIKKIGVTFSIKADFISSAAWSFVQFSDRVVWVSGLYYWIIS